MERRQAIKRCDMDSRLRGNDGLGSTPRFETFTQGRDRGIRRNDGTRREYEENTNGVYGALGGI